MIKKLEGERPSRPLPPEGWGYNWRGQLVDLRGLRPGEDGLPPVFKSKFTKEAT